ncbi:MAG: hypothetical protein ACK5MZ_08370 [Aestuariibaculum sp.]
MKKIILLSLLISLNSCAQPKKSINTNNTEQLYTKINEESTVKKLDNYNKTAQYNVWVSANNCSWQLLINDTPIYSDNAAGGVNNVSFEINSSILKSGEQNIKVILYPARKVEEKGYYDVLNPNTFMQFSITKDINDEGDFETILEYDGELIEVKGNKQFSKPGLPMYVIEKKFHAKVPYELEGWSNSKQLDKENQKELEKEVVAYFEMLWNLFNKKDKEQINKLLDKKDSEIFTAWQFDEEEKEEQKKSFLTNMDNPTFIMRPLEKEMYKMVYYGGGKLVGLECTAQTYRGKSALYSIYLKELSDGRKKRRKTHYPILLHKPEGSDKLEVIR